jgi:hypothetical protein
MKESSDKRKAPTREKREFPRFPAKVAAQIEVIHAWQGASAGPFPGELYNISRSGAGLRLPRVFPPRTRLKVALPSMRRGERLGAEVVWTSASFGPQTAREAVYGVRWLEQLSRAAIEAILPQEAHQGPQTAAREPTG